MTPRIADWYKLAPAVMKGLIAAETALGASDLGANLIELVKLRASQINGCAYCIHLHATTARKLGESEMRVVMLDGWRESPLYTARERAALAWTEAVTRVIETHAPNDVYEELKVHFTEAQQVHLTLAIGVINLWNRMGISLRASHPVDTAQNAA
ncbi:carboxymuconolactone decarboxylase family protein [Ancylobacter amanitiformis]|uniref:carboxymuconolactone decarboxylase family protein n=1 Tax=Ancylobacter amanitiformis TaxID=217069 RepID=UPI0027D7CBE2|nr:carboxymuconolactone decarboxylase family protein [Ancylobacter amanitiformis]